MWRGSPREATGLIRNGLPNRNRNQFSSVVREGTQTGATVMEQGVNLLDNFPLSSPFFFLTTEICGRPRKHINFAGKPVLKIILYGDGLTQGYSTYGGSK